MGFLVHGRNPDCHRGGAFTVRVICSGRKTSRTTTLIQLAAEAEARREPSYIVCHSQREASRIFQKAGEMGLTIGFPITYAEFLREQYVRRNIKNFFIDNAEMLLQYMTPVNIAAVTILRTDDEH